MIYDHRCVKIHYKDSPKVFLVNEAPGPEEAKNGIPLFGTQGGILFRILVSAGVGWAVEWKEKNKDFSWPIKSQEQYEILNPKIKRNLKLKKEFLDLRASYIACSNSFPKWPKSSDTANDFLDPALEDILSETNVKRLQEEIDLVGPEILLICGEFAYTACTGEEIDNPSKCEGNRLNGKCEAAINKYLGANFKKIIYLGHTRRWNLHQDLIINCFKQIALELN